MIDTSLTKRYNAREGVNTEYSPIPEGQYKLRVKEVTPWQKETKNLNVIVRDESGNALVDAKGEKLRQMIPNCEFYNATVKFEVVGGEYNGRLIFHNITTHPNMTFSIPSFLYGIGLDNISAAEIQSLAVGKMCLGNVKIDVYNKKVQNKETGLVEEQPKNINRIKSLYPLQEEMPTTNGLEIAGI